VNTIISTITRSDPYDGAIETRRPDPTGEFMGSELLGNKHLFVLDLDCEAWLLQSKTPGHYHLIIDKELSESAYSEILAVLEKHRIIESGWFRQLREMGQTFLRFPKILAKLARYSITKGGS
jgi:hypothetical protein